MTLIPNQIVKFSDLEKDIFTTIAQANWQKAAAILEYVNASYPVGMLLFFFGSQDNLPAQPDSNYWQFCDGSVVSNVNSPLNGVALPDLRNKFMKHPSTGQPVLVTDGADSVNLSHNHGGTTGGNSDYGEIALDIGVDSGIAAGNHSHSISSSMGSVSTVPAHLEVQVYMRIV